MNYYPHAFTDLKKKIEERQDIGLFDGSTYWYIVPENGKYALCNYIEKATYDTLEDALAAFALHLFEKEDE